MRIELLTRRPELTVYAAGDADAEISGVVIGDLLSFIMSEANTGDLWITVQTHLNVAAVAVLKEIPLILLPSARVPSDDLVKKCLSEKICLCSSDLSSYELSLILGEAGL